MTVRRPLQYVIGILALTAAYGLIGSLALAVRLDRALVSLIWVPAGLALVAVLRGGPRWWPAAFLGSFLVSQQGGTASVAAVAIAAGAALEAVVAAALIRRQAADFRPALDRPRDVYALVGPGALIGPLCSAPVGATALVLSGRADAADWNAVCFGWWLGDAMGILLTAPVLLTAPSWLAVPWNRTRAAEAGALLAVVVATSALAFLATEPNAGEHDSLAFVIIPLLVLAALRFGPPGAAAATVATVLVAVSGTLHGLGPFANGPRHVSLPHLYAFLLVAAVTAQLLAAVQAEQRAAEAGLRASQRFNERVAAASPDVLYLFDLATQQTHYVNRHLTEWLGYSEAEVSQLGPAFLAKIFHPDDLASWPARLARWATARDGEIFETEYRLRNRAGEYRWFVSRDTVFQRDAEGRARQIIGLAQDVTARKAAAEELARQHALLRSVLDSATEAIFVKDRQGRYLLVNPAAATLFGRPAQEVIGHTSADLLDPATAARLEAGDRRVLATGQPETVEETTTFDGTARTFLTTKSPMRDAAGAILGLVGVAQDVTAFRRLQDQLRQSQKLEALGRFAGGIAHDFNNLLNAILGYAEFLLAELPPELPSRADAEAIRGVTRRAAALTRQLLTFSSRQPHPPTVVDVNGVVRDLAKLLGRLLGEATTLTTQLAPGQLRVLIDPGQLEQVVMNLAINAQDAMPAGGALTLTTAAARVAAPPPGRTPGPYVCLTVRDTGVGMDAETQAKIFEPFFTTKGPGKGTGLGLATVYGIVQQARGYLEVDSAPGQGTTFRVFLPQTADATPAEPPPPSAALVPGTETVVVAEDEEAVRALACRALRQCGYQVLEAATGPAAAELCARHPGPVHLLLTDVLLPGLTGLELRRLVEQARPGIRVLFMSAYADSALRRAAGDDVAPLLEKPFGVATLTRWVRAVLDGQAQGPAG